MAVHGLHGGFRRLLYWTSRRWHNIYLRVSGRQSQFELLGIAIYRHKTMNHQPPRTLEDIKAERRRQRWNYFLTPFIAMASIVFSIGMLMFFGKSCQDRIPADAPFRTNPLFKQYAPLLDKATQPGRKDDLPAGEKHSSNQGENSEGTSPSK